MKLTYPILSDNSRTHIRAWGVLHPQEGIARPSMFLVNKEGQIVWRYIGEDATDRPDMLEVMKELKAAN